MIADKHLCTLFLSVTLAIHDPKNHPLTITNEWLHKCTDACFIGFGELPGCSAEVSVPASGFLVRQFNRCHSFCHIKGAARHQTL